MRALQATLSLTGVWVLTTRAQSAPDVPLNAPAPPKPIFELLSPDHTGVKFAHRIQLSHEFAYLYHSGYACGGVAVGDVNGDARPDIFLVSGPDDNALFLNKGDFRFEPSTSESLADGGAWGVGTAMADIDADGDLDLFVTNYESPNRLWINNGHGTFAECGSKTGIDFAGPSHSPYFADFDADGDLDLFLLTNRVYSPFGRPAEPASEPGPDGQPRVKDKFARYLRVVRAPGPAKDTDGSRFPKGGKQMLLEYGHPDRLYRNDGLGPDGIPRFRDVTYGSGLEDVAGYGLSALIWDVNGDSRMDVYVANDFTDGDRLWLNAGPGPDGGFRFCDATEEFLPYTTWSSMGSDIADVNGDGRLDFFVADMAGSTHFKAKTGMGEMRGYRRQVLEYGWPRQAMRNMLFIDSGAGRFFETAYMSGIARSDWTWAVKFSDFDLDGRQDLFLTNGAARHFADSDISVPAESMIGRPEWEIFKDKPEGREQHLAFRNTGGEFTDVSRLWNLDFNGMSYGAATGDMDGDGDVDLVVCNLVDNVSLCRNRATETGSHWLKVRLEGVRNRQGHGAVVTARLEDGTSLVRLMNPHTGFLSSNEPVLHFGLASRQSVAALEVRWPDGSTQVLGSQRADQLVIVREADNRAVVSAPPETVPGGKPAAAPDGSSSLQMFVEVAEKRGLKFKHDDKPFDDYRREFLLPGKLSQYGPGLAVSDVNGDQLDDIFVGGAATQSGGLFVHQRDHTFKLLASPPWAAHAASEDMGVLFFDADRDGDTDLYIASGSNEWEPLDSLYTDHLYVNESAPGGAVVFREAPPAALPPLRESNSCVIAADFDRDGDLDLFVGARSVPGRYLETPNSALLLNESTRAGEVKFSDATERLAPGLRTAGLVTGALWSDVDSDGWIDLLVTCEWGPLRLFHNRTGKLESATDSAGLSKRTGWWNAVTGADFDGDGDIDYAAMNVGFNTKYGRPGAEKPSVLYRGDMDENGVVDLVEAKVSNEGELPVRGRSCSSIAMPFIKEKFGTYRKFALADLAGIYTGARLENSIRVEANEFASGLLVNESKPGEPRFSWKLLPEQAQMSPCFGAAAADFTGNGPPALAIVQNLFSREPETGLWRGGLGTLLRSGGGSCSFAAVAHATSGFIIDDDGKALALCDLDVDARPDLVATQNDRPLLAFANNSPAEDSRRIAVRLEGLPGNPSAIGARITLMTGGSILSICEITAGSGYLSQSTPTAFFSAAKTEQSLALKVTWPDGPTSESPVDPSSSMILVAHPKLPAK